MYLMSLVGTAVSFSFHVHGLQHRSGLLEKSCSLFVEVGT